MSESPLGKPPIVPSSKVEKKKKPKSIIFEKIILEPFDHYQIVEELGQGSYGRVYQGIDRKTGKLTAVKIIPIEPGDDLEEIEHEIEILRNCSNGNEHIVNYIDSFYHPSRGDLWIIIEYCGGGSIADILNFLGQTFKEEQILYITRSILLGLEYLHKNKRIHRDIKAANVLVFEDGSIKLTDFGISTQLNRTLSKRKTFIGTPLWMAPEVIKEASGYDQKADIWSLGITIIELCDRFPPLHGIHPMKAVLEIPKNPSPTMKEPGKWSDEFNDFLRCCLEKEQKKRKSAVELLKHEVFGKYKNLNKNCLRKSVEQLRAFFDQFGGRGGFFQSIGKKKDAELIYDHCYSSVGNSEFISENGSELNSYVSANVSEISDDEMEEMNKDDFMDTIKRGSMNYQKSLMDDYDSLNTTPEPSPRKSIEQCVN